MFEGAMASSGFTLTPHKLSMCLLLFHGYAGGGNKLSLKARHRLSFLLLRLAKDADGFLEPTLEDLEMQLKQELGELSVGVADMLAGRLLALSSPEDLLTFCNRLRDILVPSPYCPQDEEMLAVDQNSVLGLFLRRCILAFNLLSFEGTCRLLSELDAYRRPALAIAKASLSGKESLANHSEEEEEDEEDDEAEDGNEEEQGDEDEMQEDENEVARMTPAKERVGSSRRGFGIPLVSTEGSEELEVQGLEGFGAMLGGNSASVRDGGFAFAFGDVVNRGRLGTQGSFLSTYDQVDTYMRDQAVLIEKELGAPNKADLDRKFDQIKKLAPDMHRVHYLEYLNSVHHQDYPAAMWSLHQYYDYTAGKGNLPSGVDVSFGRFQSGAFGLGKVHEQFGHIDHALQALSETVRLAQQNNDDYCLAYALGFLCHLLSSTVTCSEGTEAGTVGECHPLAARQQLLLSLKRCLKRALELKLPDLVAFSRLALAKFDLQHVRRIPHLGGLRSFEHLGTSPIDVCKSLRLSPYLLSDAVLNAIPVTGTSSQRVGTGGGPGGTSSGTRLGPISETTLKLAGTSHILRACSWELYGSDPMIRASTLIHAYCYSKFTSADDLAIVYVKLARHLASHKGYGVAISALDQAKRKLPPRARTLIRSAQLQFVHKLSLNRGNIKLAWIACAELSAMPSPITGVDMEMKFEASYCHILTLLAAGKYSEAADVAGELFALCYKHDMQLEVVKILLLIAEIHKKSGNPVTGLSYVLASITLCQSLSLDLLHATSKVSLAELWLDMGIDHAERALQLVNQCVPLVLGHGCLEVRARTNLCIARCYLSNPDFSVSSNPEQVLEPLEQAAEEFMILEDKDRASEAFYLQALTLNTLGRTEGRDKAADSFNQCIAELNQGQECENVILPV